MTQTPTTKREYPWTSIINGQPLTVRPLERKDLDAFLQFAKQLPEEDLLFLTFDITDRSAMEQRIQEIETNRVVMLLAEMDGQVVGYSSLLFNQTNWTRHLGEIRLLVKPDKRGFGLGKLLINEIFARAQELGLKKLIARMVVEQPGARKVFEHLGFKAEALLADHTIDRQNRTHDLVIMSYDVTGFTE